MTCHHQCMWTLVLSYLYFHFNELQTYMCFGFTDIQNVFKNITLHFGIETKKEQRDIKMILVSKYLSLEK